MTPSLERLGLLMALAAATATSVHAASTYEFRAPKKGLAVSADANVPAPAPAPSPAPAPAPAPAPTYVAQLSTTELGFDTAVGTPLTKQVVLSNEGTGTLTLTAPVVTGAAFSANTACGSALAPGGSCLTDVTFTPTAMGAASGSVSFGSNATGGPLELTLTGIGRLAQASLSAQTDATFGTVTTGTNASRVFVFTNTGNTALSGVAASVTGSAALSLVAGGTTCGTAGSPSTLAEGASCTVTVKFAPTETESLSNAAVHVASSATSSPASVALSGSATMPPDANIASVGLLMHADALPFTDSSPTSPKTVTNSNVTLDSSNYKFGTASAKFNGTNAYLNTATSSDFYMGGGDFTVEAWVRISAITTTQPHAVSISDGTGGNEIRLQTDNLGRPQFVLYHSSAYKVNIKGTAGLSGGTWYHLAAVRNGASHLLFVNGELVASTSVSHTIPNPNPFSARIGHVVGGNAAYYWNGNIDEVRITKGVARYTAAFTPPAAPFSNQ